MSINTLFEIIFGSQVNFVHKLMTCVPHKVGSESWRYFFEKLDQRDRNTTKWKNTALPEWPEDLAEFKEFAIGFQVL